MAVAPAAAEIPVLAFMVIGLLGFLGWGICVGLRGVWVNTLGLMLLTLADLLKYDKAFIHIDFGGPIRALNTTVLNALLHTGQKFQHSAGYFFHGAAVIQGWAARELMGLAHDVLAWSDWLQHSHLPRFVKAMIYAALPPLLIVRLVKAAIAANLPHLGRVVVTRVEHSVTHTVTRIMHATTGAVAIPGWALRLPHRVGRLEHDFTNVWKRLRKLELLLGATGAAALVARALGIGRISCLRGGNVGRVARRLCGMDTALVDLLLLDTLAVIGAVSIVEFTKDLQAIEGDVLGIMGSIVTEFPKG